MNRKDLLNPAQLAFFDQLMSLYERLDDAFRIHLDRSVSFGDVFIDRWERAAKLGFGEGSNVYDSALVIGNVSIGKKVWVGPFTILDGSGGLSIGDFSTISSGVQIYTHDNIKSTLTSGRIQIEKASTVIGNNTYIAPNVVITKGVQIAEYCVIAANSFVNKSFPCLSIIAGVPAKQIGKITINGDKIEFKYFNK